MDAFIPDALRTALIVYRESATHSAAHVRSQIEAALASGAGEHVECTLYRVCHASDAILRSSANWEPGAFTSTTRSLQAARLLLLRPPNPLADRIVELTVRGNVLYMVYDDGPGGARKACEDEVIVPLRCVLSVRTISL